LNEQINSLNLIIDSKEAEHAGQIQALEEKYAL
jgi:hypothetical protein